MSPEQVDRQEADARSDQFGFCVALWEALYEQRPFAGQTVQKLGANVRRGALVAAPEDSLVPTWLRKALERGLAADPGQRWPTMDALLMALARDTGRKWWRYAALAAALAIAGGSYGAAVYQGRDARVCGGAAAELGSAWGPEQRSAVEQALRSTGVAYAERAATTTLAHLDAYAERWAAVHTDACLSNQRGYSSPRLLDLQMACLRQRRSELVATAAVLEQTTRETVAQAVDTARGLPPVALCEDRERLQAEVAPPDDPAIAAEVDELRGKLARLQALERGERNAEALVAVLPLLGEAEVLRYLPLVAEAALLAGKLCMHERRLEARGHLGRALQAGLEARVDTLVAEALALQIFTLAAVEKRPVEALTLVPLGWGFLRRLGDPPGLMALMHNNIGTVHHELGQREAAIHDYDAALALLDRHAPDDPLRWAILFNLAGALADTGQHSRTSELLRLSVGPSEALYGPCHQVSAGLRHVRALSEEALGHPDAAVQGVEAALVCLTEDYPGHALEILGDLGRLYWQRGELGEVRRQIARGEELLRRAPQFSLNGLGLETLRAQLELAEGQRTAAQRRFQELRVQASERLGAGSEVLAVIDVQLALIAHGDHDDEQALVYLQRTDPALVRGMRPGDRGLYAFTLARVLRALGRNPERVVKLVDEAIAAYTMGGAPYVRNVAELRAWQATGA